MTKFTDLTSRSEAQVAVGSPMPAVSWAETKEG